MNSKINFTKKAINFFKSETVLSLAGLLQSCQHNLPDSFINRILYSKFLTFNSGI